MSAKADNHAAACERSWELQDKTNEDFKKEFGVVHSRITRMEAKVASMAALGSALGALISRLIP